MRTSVIQVVPIPSFIVDKTNLLIQNVNTKALSFLKAEKKQIINTLFTQYCKSKINHIGEFKDQIFYSFDKKSYTGTLYIQEYFGDSKVFIISFQPINNTGDNRFKNIFESASDGIIVTDKKLKILEVNPSFCEITAITKSEILGQSIFTLARKHADKKSLNGLLEYFSNLIGGEETSIYEIEHENKTLCISVNTKKCKNHYIGIIRDNTDFKTAINESEQKYRTLVEASNDSILIVQKGKIVFSNKSFYPTTGYSQNELLGKHIINFIPEKKQKEVIKIYNQVAQFRKTNQRFETIIINKQGDQFDIEATLIPINYLGEEAEQVVLKNTTRQKRAEIALKESEEKFKFLSESTFEGILVHKKGRVLDANDAFLKMTGFNRDEAINEQVLDYIPFAKDKAKILINIVKNNAKPYHVTVSKKNGERFIATLQAKNVMHKGQKVRIASVRDETENFKIKKNLEDSEQRYRTLFENTGTATCIIEKDNYISLSNHKFEELTGYSKSEIQNKKKWTDFIHPDDLSRMIHYQDKRLARKKGVPNQYEFQLIDKNNNTKDILVLVNMVANSSNRVASLLDISDRKKAENQLKKLNERLKRSKEKAEESDRLKSAFLANMSHEIRTPMNGILGFTDLLREPDLSGEEYNLYIDVIKRSGVRMLDTVNNLIDISKIETGQMETFTSKVNVNQELKGLFLFFEPEANNKGIQLKWVKRINDEEAIIHTDDQKLNSILTNLIKNAIKYSDSGIIEMGCTKIENNYLEFSVKDNGFGIPKSRLKSIFNRFEQVSNPSSKATEGSGLGLAISRAYVKMLGGKISAKSEIGKGSEFIFTIACNYQ